jgi:hypothetical protein
VDHERYMRLAVEIARGNPDAPVGCVIVEGTEVAEGLNDAERSPILRGETAATIDPYCFQTQRIPEILRHAGPRAGGRAGAGLAVRRACAAHGTAGR